MPPTSCRDQGLTPAVSIESGIAKGDRRALAKAITLVESTRRKDRQSGFQLLSTLAPGVGRSRRIGITGIPGVGKSTFIEAVGMAAIERDYRVAVLSVDPSSTLSGGSILGDKTRMAKLSVHVNAYVRPSPSGRTLGGVTRRTRECIWVLEAAGYDFIVVETVGVGQSETAVAGMTDCFLLLLPPAGGDELQGIKRGIVELADLVVVNKSDGELMSAAKRACADYGNALRLFRPRYAQWRAPVGTCSALTGEGIHKVLDNLDEFFATLERCGEIDAKRQWQSKQWLRDEMGEQLLERLRSDEVTNRLIDELGNAVAQGALPASAAADRIVRSFLLQTD